MSRSFVSVIVRKQTYRNLAYLVVASSPGLYYLSVLAYAYTGIVENELLIVLLGVPPLLVILTAFGPLACVQRWLTTRLLGIDLTPAAPDTLSASPATSVRDRLVGPLTASEPRRSVLFLWVIATTGFLWLATGGYLLLQGLAYVATPLFAPEVMTLLGVTSTSDMYARWTVITIEGDVWIAETAGAIIGSFIDLSIGASATEVHTPGIALLFSIGGVVLVLISLYLSNGIAHRLGQFAQAFLRPEVDTHW
ncbi:sensor domain-containing protein [Halocatena salina]|uniref:Sensor domain-containing protein n=1 Tax=Halocatena salina TaxID=2934340 RepID=A0A8U0A9M4_9EURY|nr:sensor domain-containing protein [Halocatena salina]UPM44547.1 sensor domain-containing protein [Halocatena salina]